MRMVRGFFVAVGLMLSTGLAQSQAIYANVTATVVDPNSHPLAGAVLTAILVDTAGRQVTSATSPNGQIVSTIVKPIVLDATGGFTLQLLNTSTLSTRRLTFSHSSRRGLSNTRRALPPTLI
jgi:hypothetical protein